jgi:hypothetical protein
MTNKIRKEQIETLYTADITESEDKNYVSDSELADIGDISGKQDTLVSGTNIKTINGSSVLGSGDITLSGGAIDSVNGQTGVVVLDADDIDDTSTTNKFVTSGDLTKLSNISVTQAVDLDTIESDTTTNNAKVSNATHTGDVTGATALTIANDAVTFTKMQNISTARLLGRSTAGSGDIEELTIGNGLTLSSGVLSGSTNVIQFYRATTTITDITAGIRWLVSDAQANLRNSVVDLSQASQVRLMTVVTTAGNSGSKIIARYKVSGFSTNKADYSILGASSTEVVNSLTTGGDIWVDSGWITIEPTAKTDTTYVGLFTIDGNGTADPVTQQTVLMYR